MSASSSGSDGEAARTIALLRRRSQQRLWEKSASVVQRRGRLQVDAARHVDLFSQPREGAGHDDTTARSMFRR